MSQEAPRPAPHPDNIPNGSPVMNEIPVINLRDFYSSDGATREKTITTIAEGFRQIGFIFVESPQITKKLPEVYRVYDQLFTLPLDVKLSYEQKDIHHQRGYTPSKTEIGIMCQKSGRDGEAQPDAKENWFIGPEMSDRHPLVVEYPELYAPNIWPKEVPDFQRVTKDLYGNLYSLGKELLGALEVYLGYSPGYFNDMVENSPTSLRPLHYPPISESDAGNTVWGCDHTDINLLTVLPASTKAGLWVKTRNGDWIPGMAPPNCSLVQVGDMLQYITGGYFLSAVHKVVAPDHATTVGRYSSALFIHARSNYLFQVDHNLTRTPELFPNITAGNLLYQRLNEIGLAKKQARE